MRTNTAPWDYNRPQAPANPSGTCPKCGKGCYSGAVPGGTLYTCLTCGTFTVKNWHGKTSNISVLPEA